MRKRCPDCMEPIGRKKVCPACGFDLNELNNKEGKFTGSVINKRYLLGNVYKKSAESKVYIAFDEETNKKVFIRVFTGDEMANVSPIGKQLLLERFVNYNRSLATIGLCSLLPRIKDVFIEKNVAFLVTEYFEGQSLRFLIKQGKTVGQGKAFKITQQLIEGLKVLHGSRMIYGTICPENLYILKNGGIMLFGMGSPFFEVLNSETVKLKYYNRHFTAPELFDSKTKRGSYCDVYSISALLYYMLTNKEPPESLYRPTGDNIKAPCKLNKNISKAMSNAILNGLNWQIKYRTATTEDFMLQLTSKKVSRNFSYRNCWAKVLYVLKVVISLLTNKFNEVYDLVLKKIRQIDFKDKKPLFTRLLAGAVAAIIALIVFLILLPNIPEKQEPIPVSSEITWYYGEGNENK